MKSIILLVLFIGLVSCTSAHKKDDVMGFEKACVAETKVSEKEAHDFWEANVNYDNTTPNMKCQLKCVMEKLGHLKAGVFDAEKTAKDWSELAEVQAVEKVDPKAFAACKQEKGANDCETAFKITKCVRQFKA